MNKKTLIILALICGFTYALHPMVRDCECDPGFHINPYTARCVPNPTSGQPKFIPGCVTYLFQDAEDGEDGEDGETLICNFCDGELNGLDLNTQTCEDP